MIEWNTDMAAAPRDGFYVLLKFAPGIYPGKNKRSAEGYGVLACFRDGAWRITPRERALPEPIAWRWRPQGDFL